MFLIFRMFRRQARRPVPTPRPRFRSAVEVLEGRALPSVSVTPFTDPGSGAAGLRIHTDGQNDTVSLTDDSVTHKTTVVADGQTSTFDHQFSLFDLELMSKKDTLTFGVAGAYANRKANLHVALGTGENHFTFNPNLTAITNHSDVALNVQGHDGNDFLNLNFGDILESRLNVTGNHLGGSKSNNPAAVRDVVTFGTSRAGVRNSSVDVNLGLGHGNNNLQFNYGTDLGHLPAAAGTPDKASDFGPSTFNVNITGSNRRQDVDNVKLFANGEVNTGSTLNFNTRFLAGTDSFQGVVDANLFQIDDDGGAFLSGGHSGGAAHFNIQGGSGNNAIGFQSINQNHTIELSGLLDVNIVGGAGKNTIKTDFGGAGFTDDDPFELAATNRAVRLRVDGGSGPNTIKVNLANAATATFAYDVAIQGGTGRNDITFVGTNPSSGTPSFGPAGSVFIDGGFGGRNTVDVFGNFPVVVENA